MSEIDQATPKQWRQAGQLGVILSEERVVVLMDHYVMGQMISLEDVDTERQAEVRHELAEIGRAMALRLALEYTAEGLICGIAERRAGRESAERGEEPEWSQFKRLKATWQLAAGELALTVRSTWETAARRFKDADHMECPFPTLGLCNPTPVVCRLRPSKVLWQVDRYRQENPRKK